jgi:hypothetical protein
MKNGLQVIFRLPYPSALPTRYAVASEVATMNLVRSHDLPVPRIHGYSTTADNPVGSKYIIIEEAAGEDIGHSWRSLPTTDGNHPLKQFSATAVDDWDRELSLRHYPFMDHDEDEYESYTNVTHSEHRAQ